MSESTIVILGRPNVGKSTLFNRLIGEMRSIVSPIEGVTRDRIYSKIEWLGTKYNLIDTGGYIPKSKNFIDQEVKFQAEIAKNEANLLLLVVDGREDILETPVLVATHTLSWESIAKSFTFGPIKPSDTSKSIH